MPTNLYKFAIAGIVLAGALALAAADETPRLMVAPRLVHLRSGPVREWSSFPEAAEAAHLEVRFPALANDREFALRLRQQDVKQAWRITLNGRPVGELVRDESDLVAYFPLAGGALEAGENTLRIESPARAASVSDDVRVGEIFIESRSVKDSLGEATLEVEVKDAEKSAALPVRITIVDANGTLQTTAAASSDRLAVRPGVIYSADGRVRCGVPAGKYTVYAGRGFEYSLAKSDVTIAAGQTARVPLAIRREVPTPGYVACDTHVHTLTHSGHGDASIDERMITLAGEGIELPIATDHNTHIDYESHARRLGVRGYFTPVIGNEFTTTRGHFNIFPVSKGARVPDHRLREWPAIFDEIFTTPGVKIAILNHARDLHGGTRPFGPEWFNAAIGENVAGWPMKFSAMEVINSGATQTDPLELARDWMALLNRGYAVTPVGSSDSHDVSRFIVGQGRTYIRVDDHDVSRIDVEAAVESFLQGRVLVSYGLIAELTVGGKHHSGDTAAVAGEEVDVTVRVLGPEWTEAKRVLLYANGQLVREEKIIRLSAGEMLPGVQWQATWKLPRPRHDVHLVAIAVGDAIAAPYWPTAKPYQPTSPDCQPQTLGISGAVWLDADDDGRRTSAREYAERAASAAGGNAAKLVANLAAYDSAIAAQAAHAFRAAGGLLDGDELAQALKSAPAHVADGFRAYREAWRANELARANR